MATPSLSELLFPEHEAPVLQVLLQWALWEH